VSVSSVELIQKSGWGGGLRKQGLGWVKSCCGVVGTASVGWVGLE
jgi:hypothetical protein